MSKHIRIRDRFKDIESLLRLFDRQMENGEGDEMRFTMSAIHTLAEEICWIIDEVDE